MINNMLEAGNQASIIVNFAPNKPMIPVCNFVMSFAFQVVFVRACAEVRDSERVKACF